MVCFTVRLWVVLRTCISYWTRHRRNSQGNFFLVASKTWGKLEQQYLLLGEKLFKAFWENTDIASKPLGNQSSSSFSPGEPSLLVWYSQAMSSPSNCYFLRNDWYDNGLTVGRVQHHLRELNVSSLLMHVKYLPLQTQSSSFTRQGSLRLAIPAKESDILHHLWRLKQSHFANCPLLVKLHYLYWGYFPLKNRSKHFSVTPGFFRALNRLQSSTSFHSKMASQSVFVAVKACRGWLHRYGSVSLGIKIVEVGLFLHPVCEVVRQHEGWAFNLKEISHFHTKKIMQSNFWP